MNEWKVTWEIKFFSFCLLVRRHDEGDEKGGSKENEIADLDTAIKLTGFGRYHIFLIALGGYCFLSSGLEYGLHAYTLPYAQCDLKISTAQMGLINAMFMAGK